MPTKPPLKPPKPKMVRIDLRVLREPTTRSVPRAPSARGPIVRRPPVRPPSASDQTGYVVPESPLPLIVPGGMHFFLEMREPGVQLMLCARMWCGREYRAWSRRYTRSITEADCPACLDAVIEFGRIAALVRERLQYAERLVAEHRPLLERVDDEDDD